ncbi:hypothetical protein CULCOIPH002_05850 [Corynebacterium ulcerans]|nr:hypothetical protein CULCOIPH001_01930 [Corynebacterium ulcerans]GJJ35673.1 hypothetical protein CULCOIPH002_05850 [Corynebacterium ulcerans]
MGFLWHGKRAGPGVWLALPPRMRGFCGVTWFFDRKFSKNYLRYRGEGGHVRDDSRVFTIRKLM